MIHGPRGMSIFAALFSLLLCVKHHEATPLTDAVESCHWDRAQEIVKQAGDDSTRDAMLGDINKAAEAVRVGARSVGAALRRAVNSLDIGSTEEVSGVRVVSPALQWAQNASTIFMEVKYSAKWGAPSATSSKLEDAGVEKQKVFLTAAPPSGEQRFELALSMWSECDPAQSVWSGASVGRASFTIRKQKNGHWPQLTSGPAPWNAKYWFELQESLDYDSGWMKSSEVEADYGERAKKGASKVEEAKSEAKVDADFEAVAPDAPPTPSSVSGEESERSTLRTEDPDLLSTTNEGAGRESVKLQKSPKASLGQEEGSEGPNLQPPPTETKAPSSTTSASEAGAGADAKGPGGPKRKPGGKRSKKALKAKLAAVDKAAKKARKGIDQDVAAQAQEADVEERQRKAQVERAFGARRSFAASPPAWFVASVLPFPLSSSSLASWAVSRAAAFAASSPQAWRAVSAVADAREGGSTRNKKKKEKEKKEKEQANKGSFLDGEVLASPKARLSVCSACLAVAGLCGFAFVALELRQAMEAQAAEGGGADRSGRRRRRRSQMVNSGSAVWVSIKCLLVLMPSVAALGLSSFLYRALWL